MRIVMLVLVLAMLGLGTAASAGPYDMPGNSFDVEVIGPTPSAVVWAITDTGLGNTTQFVTETWWSGTDMTMNSRTDMFGDPGYSYNIGFSGLGQHKIVVGDDTSRGGLLRATANAPSDGALNGNLTGYGFYEMTILNPSSNPGAFMANIFINNGNVPNPGDQHLQDVWTWLLPGQQKTFSIDLSQLANPTQITNIGYQVMVNVPEPGSLLALAMGLVGTAGFAIRRRRS